LHGHVQGKDYKGKTLYAGRAQKKTERSAALKAKFDEVGSYGQDHSGG
jgi:hypothetical protein